MLLSTYSNLCSTMTNLIGCIIHQKDIQSFICPYVHNTKAHSWRFKNFCLLWNSEHVYLILIFFWNLRKRWKIWLFVINDRDNILYIYTYLGKLSKTKFVQRSNWWKIFQFPKDSFFASTTKTYKELNIIVYLLFLWNFSFICWITKLMKHGQAWLLLDILNHPRIFYKT